MYELNIKSWAALIVTALFLTVGGVGSCMYIRPRYNVWSQEMAGKAEHNQGDRSRDSLILSDHGHVPLIARSALPLSPRRQPTERIITNYS